MSSFHYTNNSGDGASSPSTDPFIPCSPAYSPAFQSSDSNSSIPSIDLKRDDLHRETSSWYWKAIGFVENILTGPTLRLVLFLVLLGGLVACLSTLLGYGVVFVLKIVNFSCLSICIVTPRCSIPFLFICISYVAYINNITCIDSYLYL